MIMRAFRKSYLTTFEIGQICEVNPTTVQNWIKGKKLKAYVTPGGHRRIRREDLIAFMKEFGMPIPTTLDSTRPYVLIVDDEREVIEILTSIMHSSGEDIEITGVESGFEALLTIGERKPDLLILDLKMPGMNGFEVCRTLKENPGTRNIRIVAVSGDRDPEIRSRIEEAGADLFFSKPFDVIEFRSQCLRLMREAESSAG